MALDINLICNKLIVDMDKFENEVKKIYSTLVIPNWCGELHGFPNTLYGYMMLCFSNIDLFSAYWKGDCSTRGQTDRMIGFMQEYLYRDREACAAAVQIWRHKLMHTGKPQKLTDENSKKIYRWLLHWWEHLPVEQHFTFCETSDSKILNIGLVYLLKDIQIGLKKFLNDLSENIEFQKNFEKVELEIQNSRFKNL